MKYKNYVAEIKYDEEHNVLLGTVKDTKENITFSGYSINELEREFKKSIDDYLGWNESLGYSKSLGKLLTQKETEEGLKQANKYIDARHKAYEIIKDATAKYVKSKTHARSKKAAMENESIDNSPRYAKLADYRRREDINENYGWAFITASERDRLEKLWDEREELREKTKNGSYQDDVTECLYCACESVLLMFEEEIRQAQKNATNYKMQRREIENSCRGAV